MTQHEKERAELSAGDLVLADNVLWEIIEDKPDGEMELKPGVALVDGHYEQDGKIMAYAVAVRGFGLPCGYHQLEPSQIEKVWRQCVGAEKGK